MTRSAARFDAAGRLARSLEPAGAAPRTGRGSPRVAVLVLACALPEFDACVRATRRTWGGVDVPGVDVWYVYGRFVEPDRIGYADLRPWVAEPPDVPDGSVRRRDDVLFAGCADVIWAETDCLLRKRLAAFAHLGALGRYDYVTTVCATSYVDLAGLGNFVATLPGEGVYQGPAGVCAETGRPYVSGSCIVMSADVALGLALDARRIIEQNDGAYADDVALARWVADHVTDDGPDTIAARLASGRPGTDGSAFVFPPGVGLAVSADDPGGVRPVPGAFNYHFRRDDYPDLVDDFHARVMGRPSLPAGWA